MGTLFNQPPRMEHLTTNRVITIGNDVKEIASELRISFNDALNLYLAVAKIDDYDTKDEQFTGLGELLKDCLERLTHNSGDS